ncbi:MAG: DUF3299 domain-containing protein [Alphaproteobacteria bacterium]|nr:DUF3299 domain-containing protein [Alphaproteobacteria bacterium]
MKRLIANFMLVLFTSITLASAAQAKPITLSWEDLIPQQGGGEFLVIPVNSPTIGLPKKEDFEGNDEEYAQMVDSYEIKRYSQPQGASIRTDLDGKIVRVPGFITPLEIDGEKVVEFLLVPYLGACIHIPAPPGNQIIYVSKTNGISLDKLYDPIWVTGKLKASPMTTLLANVGYRMQDVKIEAYTRKQ